MRIEHDKQKISAMVQSQIVGQDAPAEKLETPDMAKPAKVKKPKLMEGSND